MTLAGASRGHTQRHIQQLLGSRGLVPRSSLGQCFLTDLNLLDILLDAADVGLDDLVLEVGTGTGSLTSRLASRARAVLSVELDRGLCGLASESLSEFGNVRLLQADILANKNSLNPEVLQAVDQFAAIGAAAKLKLVANLPYAVATPVISLILLDERPWERLVVTIQKELADRLMARPRTKDYGSLSIATQALGQVELLRELPPSAFWPRPAVWSAFVRIQPCPAKRAAIRDVRTFSKFVRGVMLHRRKVLRTAMSSLCSQVSKSEIDTFLTGQGIDLRTRAEALTPEEFVSLSNQLPSGWVK
jgi:16S rRNA (adenine1518-N6/adenine1519-N6)-dimethyltransferase